MTAVVAMQSFNPAFMLIVNWEGGNNFGVTLFLVKLLESRYRKQTVLGPNIKRGI